MDIKEILSLLSNMCIYYYMTFYEKIRKERIKLPSNIHQELMRHIYNKYINDTDGSYVYDVEIMKWPYSEQYELNKDILDAVEIMGTIDKYIDSHDNCYNTTIPINVISLSPHPLENYVHFTHSWIKWVIELYRF